MAIKPPKPASRPEGAGFLTRIRLFRKDMFSSQPDKLYRAKMAEMRALFYSSYMVNQPDLVRRVLIGEAENFPKSTVLSDTLLPLLGQSIFATTGEKWQAQREIINPAFKGCPSQAFYSMRAAADDAIARLHGLEGQEIEMEFVTSFLAADIIFRTLFSKPLTEDMARKVYESFREYQNTQPLWTIPALLRLPNWVPRFRSKASIKHASEIRALLAGMVDERAREIEAGTAPDDLATSLMTSNAEAPDEYFEKKEMLDQVAIFFLAGHETSASALAWGFYLLALDEKVQEKVAKESGLLSDPPQAADMSALRFTKDVFHEILRLYPPVPMFLRDAAQKTEFRGRKVAKGSLVIVSPWHL